MKTDTRTCRFSMSIRSRADGQYWAYVEAGMADAWTEQDEIFPTLKAAMDWLGGIVLNPHEIEWVFGETDGELDWFATIERDVDWLVLALLTDPSRD